jgi:preprotein translocase subunit SecG
LIYVLYTIYTLACVFLILVILLQSGKGGDVAAAFGGAGSQTAFGPRGAQKPLEKATVVAAILFMLLALIFSLPGLTGGSSVVGEAPAAPSPSPTAAAPAVATSPEVSASPAATTTASPAAPKASPSASPAK